MGRGHRTLAFDDKFEPLARELYRDACCNGESILSGGGGIHNCLKDSARMREFFRQAHIGFSRAQDRIVERLVELETGATPIGACNLLPEELIHRKIADAVAWQILGGQLYVARRLCANQSPPRLTTSNYQSTLSMAHQIMEPEFIRCALMADITTFIQTADLAIRDSLTGALSFAEVKEGKKNHDYLDALNGMAQPPSSSELEAFAAREGKHAVDQLKRIAKQAQRMQQTSDLLNTGFGLDPYLKVNVHIADHAIIEEKYDEQLRSLIDTSKLKGWAIDIIDDCLFIGAYRGAMGNGDGASFRAWFSGESGNQPFPVINLMQCMEMPLALPVFSRLLSSEQMFDVLFGRCKVYMGIDLDRFQSLIRETGVHARWASRKETAKWGPSSDLVKANNQGIVCELNGEKMAVGDGLLMRLAFHGTRPWSIAHVIKRSLEDDARFDPRE